MLILLTNDDGIYAPGLAAMERELERLGDVYVVAPATEQSGVGHAITYLSPLVVKELFEARQRRGWAVEGSPADSVKIGIFEFCPRLPDLVISGINGGLNAGINVLYSGTVAAAIEGAFFGITSMAVSLEFADHAEFDKAAALARGVIEQVLEQQPSGPQLYNLNIPTAALNAPQRDVRRGTDGAGPQRRTIRETRRPTRPELLLGPVGSDRPRRRTRDRRLGTSKGFRDAHTARLRYDQAIGPVGDGGAGSSISRRRNS